MKLFIATLSLFLSFSVASGQSLLDLEGKFLLIVNGSSYHLYDRDRKFDFERTRNESHAAVGLEYEFKSDSNVIKSASCISFRNSYYTSSVYCGGSYKMKDKLLSKGNYYGFKYGLVTGYEKKEYIEGDDIRIINKYDLKYTPVAYPSYWIREDSYELELSYIINPVARKEDVFTFLIKIVL